MTEHDILPGSEAVREVEGARFVFRRGTTDELVLRTEYGRARFFPAGFEPPVGATIVDVGAHIGVFAVLAGIAAPTGIVHALEAGAENVELLERNVAGNGCTNVRCHRVALGGVDGTVRLHHGPGSVGHSLYRNPGWDGVEAEPRSAAAGPLAPFEDVRAQRLATFFDAQAVQHVDFMKMNIEGAEYDVLPDADDETLRRVALMHVELHPEDDGRCERLLERLVAAGFTTDVVWSDDPTVAGWVTARRRSPGAR